jgi:uroporphyrinogen decarboxylase
MNSKERVIKTLEFNNPDRIPVDLWVLPATQLKYGEEFDKMRDKYETDIVQLSGPLDLSFDPRTYKQGSYTDLWGSKWSNLQAGMVGEVKQPVFDNSENIDSYIPPIEMFENMWNENRPKLDCQIKTAADNGKFVIGGWISLFERMQFLRGTENLYCDIAEQNNEFFKIREFVSSFYKSYLEAWLETDVDGMAFGDDWGSQRALLISPDIVMVI